MCVCVRARVRENVCSISNLTDGAGGDEILRRPAARAVHLTALSLSLCLPLPPSPSPSLPCPRVPHSPHSLLTLFLRLEKEPEQYIPTPERSPKLRRDFRNSGEISETPEIAFRHGRVGAERRRFYVSLSLSLSASLSLSPLLSLAPLLPPLSSLLQPGKCASGSVRTVGAAGAGSATV